MSNWLPRIVKRSTETAKGDVIAAEVGKDARGIAVGKYILQIGTIAIPFWAVVVVVLAAIAGAAFTGFNAFRNAGTLSTLIETVSATQTPTPVPKMEGNFNVAIAQFQVQGQGEGLDTAERLANEFAYAVQGLTGELKPVFGEIEVRLPRETGKIEGENAEIQANARALAKEIDADVVVYGVISVDGDRATIQPEFYINDSVNDGLVEASEFTGQYEMGGALDVEGLRNRDLRNQGAQTLTARFHDLAWIIRGLSAYVVGHYPTARECFREARASNALNTPELLDVMIGNTFINEGLLTEEPSLYAESEDSYKMAIKANGEYSRAHVGLAGVLYERARTSAGANGYKDVDTKLLDDSIGEYEKALSPDTKRPLFADIESKVHFGLGQAYFLKALVIADRGDEEQASALLEQSRQAYQSVINEYLGADADSQERLKERTAHAHARLGLMHRFVNQTDKARAEYVLALDMVPKLGRTIIDRARYNVALGEIDLKEGKLEDAKVRHENAAKLIPTPNAPKVLAEKQKYLDTAAKIQAQIDVLSSPTPKD